MCCWAATLWNNNGTSWRTNSVVSGVYLTVSDGVLWAEPLLSLAGYMACSLPAHASCGFPSY
jgi:hypothetical protein